MRSKVGGARTRMSGDGSAYSTSLACMRFRSQELFTHLDVIIESKAMALRGTGKAGFVLLSVILLIAGSSYCQSAGHARSKF